MDVLSCVESFAARADRSVCDVELIESQSGSDAWPWYMAAAVSLSGRLPWCETDADLDEAVLCFLDRFKEDAITVVQLEGEVDRILNAFDEREEAAWRAMAAWN